MKFFDLLSQYYSAHVSPNSHFRIPKLAENFFTKHIVACNPRLHRSTLEKSANATANQTSLEPKQKSKSPVNAPIEPISNFIDKMRFKHLRKLPNAKSAIHAVTYPELKDWFFKEVDRRKREEKSRRARPKSVRRKLKLEEVIPKPGEKRGLEELASVDACPDALEEDAVQTLVDRIERYDDVGRVEQKRCSFSVLHALRFCELSDFLVHF